MKLGIAGTGKIVQEALPVLLEAGAKPGQILLMGRESSAERTRKLWERYQLGGYVLDFEELLASDADTIYIALPNQLHCECTERALRSGKHVILEKPAAVRRAELARLFAIAEEEHKILVEAMTLHYLPAWISLKEKLADLGEIKLVNFTFCQYSSRYDAFQRGEIAPAFDPACAGGALTDLNVYNLHAILGLFGTPDAVTYYPNMERGVDTSGILILNYGSFQAVLVAAKDCQAPVSSTIQGTKGCIRIPVPANQVNCYELWNNKKEVQRFDFSSERHRMYWEFVEFFRMIEEQDFAAAKSMQAVSLEAAGVLETARAQNCFEIGGQVYYF